MGDLEILRRSVAVSSKTGRSKTSGGSGASNSQQQRCSIVHLLASAEEL